MMGAYSMKKWIAIGLVALALPGCENKRGAFFEAVVSENRLPVAVDKLLNAIKKRNLVYFTTIDHAANAQKAGIALKPETVVIFGNPKIDTQLMVCNPSMGLDLPMRMLFTTDYEGQTRITYTNPEYWTLKHNIKDKKCLAIIQKIHIALQELAEEAAAK
jgi:uncharacterized protein (DUF302 family)